MPFVGSAADRLPAAARAHRRNYSMRQKVIPLLALAGVEIEDIVQPVQDAMWQPEYRRIQAS